MLANLPLMLPAVLPLTDAGGHLGRYAIQLDQGRSAELKTWYDFHWQLVPNLGVDVLIQLLGPWLGLEPAARAIVIAIPLLQVLGILCLSVAIHGRLTPLTLFTIPLAYSYPLHFGFLNFALGQALATLALSLWVVMSRRGEMARRWIAFVPIAMVLWVCHLGAWAVFCVFAGMHDLVAEHRQRLSVGTLTRLALGGTCLLVPLLVRLIWPVSGGEHSVIQGFPDAPMKLLNPLMPLRDRWLGWDVFSAALLWGLAVWAYRQRDRSHAVGNSLVLGAGLLSAIYVVMPSMIVGANMADMRLLPIILIVALVAATPLHPEHGWLSPGWIALAGAGFATARLLGNAVSLSIYGHAMAADLAALESVPHGSRVASFIVQPCFVSILPWASDRRGHLGGYAIARRHAFSNDQWMVPGGHLLTVHAPSAGMFAADDSQIVKQDGCNKPNDITRRLHQLPRHAFDYLWIIEDGRARDIPGASIVKRTPGTVLYRLTTNS